MRQSISVLILCFAAGIASGDDSEVLITRDGISVTTSDVDEFLLTIPQQDRAGFGSSRKRLMEVIDNILTEKTLLRDAREHHVHARKDVRAKVVQAKQRVLIQAWLDQYVDNQPDADYDALAYEYYLTHREEFNQPESVTVRHLLVSAGSRGAGEARQLAADIRQRILDGDLEFKEAVRQYSDDQQTASQDGMIRRLERGKTEASFNAAAFALTDKQPLSGVIETSAGSHLIKLVERHESGRIPFEDVDARLIKRMKSQHRQRLISSYLGEIKQRDVEVQPEVLKRYLEQKAVTRRASGN